MEETISHEFFARQATAARKKRLENLQGDRPDFDLAERNDSGGQHEQTARFELAVTENKETEGVKIEMTAFPEWLHAPGQIDGEYMTIAQYFIRDLAQRIGEVLADYDIEVETLPEIRN